MCVCAGISCHLLCRSKPQEVYDVTSSAKRWQKTSMFITGSLSEQDFFGLSDEDPRLPTGVSWVLRLSN